MIDEIVVESPVDMHAHLRQDEALAEIVALTAPTWAAVLAMPNTDPIVDSLDKAIAYRRAALRDTTDFAVYPTLYFQPHYTRSFLEDAREHILSIKFYPRNLTTNSAHGCDPGDPRVYDVLAIAEELHIPINVHPEAEGYYHDREQLFIAHADDWAQTFPDLTLILEHLSDARSLYLLHNQNVFATLTPHHLLTTGNDWFGPPFDPHLYCMPCVKRPEDQFALGDAAVSTWRRKVMAGTDSAPHTEDRKVRCGCAGVFTAPIALQLYAESFDRANALHRLQDFVGGNARRIYGITPPAKTVKLVREPFVIPERYGPYVPMWAGKTISWSIAR